MAYRDDNAALFTGAQPSFEFDSQILSPFPLAPVQTGSVYGYPDSVGIAGNTPPSNNDAVSNAANASSTGGAHNNPIFWYIALMATGVAGLGLVAHLSVKGK